MVNFRGRPFYLNEVKEESQRNGGRSSPGSLRKEKDGPWVAAQPGCYKVNCHNSDGPLFSRMAGAPAQGLPRPLRDAVYDRQGEKRQCGKAKVAPGVGLPAAYVT